MKKSILCLSALLALVSLAGCGPTTSEPTTNPSTSQEPTTAPVVTPSEKVINAVASLKEKSHYVDVAQDVAIYKPKFPEVCDIYNKYTYTFGYFYSETEKSYSIKTETEFCDLDKETGEKIFETIRKNSTAERLYFKDKDGTAYSEEVTFQNEVVTYTQAFYDEDLGYYKPVIFDSEFKNPWDYISLRDVKENSDGTLTLINEKADFLAECYQTVGLNFVAGNTIHLDDQGRITSIEFQIDDLVEENYTRTNTFTVTYSGRDTAKLTHRTPSTNENPKLQEALNSIIDKKNYTYQKEYIYAYGATKDLITGYFTEEEIYWRHHTEQGNEHPYTSGDDYDYKSKLMEDGTYVGYEYNLRADAWDWGIVYVSSSYPYIIDTFEENGPRFYTIDASIFKQIDEFTYEIEDYFLRESGQYFDYGFLGVNSAAFETNTNKMVIHLAEDYSLEKVETGFTFMGVDTYINYYLKDIGTTEIPSWSDYAVPYEY